MKVSKKIEPSFKPVTLEIKFETEEELELIKLLMGSYYSIAEYLNSSRDLPINQITPLAILLSKIYNALST